MLDGTECRKALHDVRGREFRPNKKVYIADGLPSSAVASRHLHPLYTFRPSHVLQERSDQVVDLREQKAP